MVMVTVVIITVDIVTGVIGDYYYSIVQLLWFLLNGCITQVLVVVVVVIDNYDDYY